MWPGRNVIPAPSFRQGLCLSHEGEQIDIKDYSRNSLFNDSQKPFCHADPGSM